MGKERRKEAKINPRELAYDMLRSQGLNSYQASKKLGISKSSGHIFEHKPGKNWNKVIENLMPSAVKTIKKLSQGQTVGEMTDIKGSDVIAANKMIWDRVSPVVQDTPTISNNTFTQINFTVSSEQIPPAIDVSKINNE